MDPDSVDKLLSLNRPYDGVCDGCEEEQTIFYKSPLGEELCTDCGKEVMDSMRERGIPDMEGIEWVDNDPSEEDNQSESPSLSDVLEPVTPTESIGGINSDTIEYSFESVNWESVDEDQIVSDNEVVAWGGYLGSYETIEVEDFKALRAYMDSTVTESNAVYITDDRVYVYAHVLENVDRNKVSSEVFTVLQELEFQGLIEGLEPVR